MASPHFSIPIHCAAALCASAMGQGQTPTKSTPPLHARLVQTRFPSRKSVAPLWRIVDTIALRAATCVSVKTGCWLSTHAGVRDSAQARYVYIDPWVRDARIDVAGEFSSCRELIGETDLDLTRSGGTASVRVGASPALLRFQRQPGAP